MESLWRPEALSRSGAGGVYQFMSKTGRQFLTVEDGVVDERLDPLRAAWAAATYMAKMAKDFNNDWPLVLTAYNTGPTRLKRVMKARHTRDIGKITPQAVQTWLSKLHGNERLSPNTVAKAYRVLKGVCDFAVEARRKEGRFGGSGWQGAAKIS